VDRPAEDVKNAAVRRRDRRENQVHARNILPRPTFACRPLLLEQDLKRDRNRAALADQVDREVQVDVVLGRQPRRVARRVAGALQLLGASLLDPLELGVQIESCLRRSHLLCFGETETADLPCPGGLVR
jgi:hypothetical protein